MEESKKEMLSTIEQSQGDLGAYQQDLAKASTQKSELETELSGAQEKLAQAEKDRQSMLEKKRKFENDLGSFRKDIEDMELSIHRAEQ